MNNSINDIVINEQDFNYHNGEKGKIAVLIYLGSGDIRRALDAAIAKYVGETPYHELIDANLDNPRMRVLLTDINKMNQERFSELKHHFIQA